MELTKYGVDKMKVDKKRVDKIKVIPQVLTLYTYITIK